MEQTAFPTDPFQRSSSSAFPHQAPPEIPEVFVGLGLCENFLYSSKRSSSTADVAVIEKLLVFQGSYTTPPTNPLLNHYTSLTNARSHTF